MSEAFLVIQQYARHPYMLALLAALLVIYQAVARRSKALPNIPVGLIVLYLVLDIVIVLLEPYEIGRWRIYLAVASTVVLYMVVIRFIVAAVIDVWLGRMRKRPLPSITRDFILAVAFVVIVLWVLRTVGDINLASLLTTSAILTAVVGLALQDTLGSFFSGLSLQIERPYQIGDWIVFKEVEGRVVGINWRTTRVQTRFDEVVYIPNNLITKDLIKNYSQPTPTWIVRIEVGVEYGAPPNKVRRVLLDVIKKHPNVVKAFRTTVRLMEFSDFSVRYTIFTKIDDLQNAHLITADLRNQIWYALRRNGIRIPFPIRDVNVRQIDEVHLKEEHGRWIRDGLRRIPVLKPLTDADIAKLAEGVCVEEYGIGEEIVHQGDAGDTMYLIRQGNCDVVIEKPDERLQRVATLGPGNFFGEMSLLTGEKRTATVVAREDATLMSIGRSAFQDVLAAHPNISEGLAQALANRQAELEQIKKEKTAVETQTKTILERIKSVFGLS